MYFLGKIWSFKFLEQIWFLTIEMSPFLLFGFIVSGVLSALLTVEMVTKYLGKNNFQSILKASLFGVPLPLCSCGVIPVFSYLRKHGASKASTTSFLISTPQTGVDSILITYGMLGPMFAFIRPIIALFTGIIGGLFTEKFVKDEYVATLKIDHEHSKKTLMDGLKYAFITLPQDIAWPLLKGILLAGLITLLIPDNFFMSYGITGLLAMIIMALVSIPMYICATASVPIAAGLILSGLEPGAAFVFLMAGPATNIATISVITKLLVKK